MNTRQIRIDSVYVAQNSSAFEERDGGRSEAEYEEQRFVPLPQGSQFLRK